MDNSRQQESDSYTINYCAVHFLVAMYEYLAYNTMYSIVRLELFLAMKTKVIQRPSESATLHLGACPGSRDFPH